MKICKYIALSREHPAYKKGFRYTAMICVIDELNQSPKFTGLGMHCKSKEEIDNFAKDNKCFIVSQVGGE